MVESGQPFEGSQLHGLFHLSGRTFMHQFGLVRPRQNRPSSPDSEGAATEAVTATLAALANIKLLLTPMH